MGFFGPKNGHKNLENQNLQNPLSQTKNRLHWAIWWPGRSRPAQFSRPKIWDFPLQNAENAEIRPNFEELYLSNRLELSKKWAHLKN